MGEWRKTKLGSIAKLSKGISYSSDEYAGKGEGYIFITLKCIAKAGGFSGRGIKYFKGLVPENQKAKAGDLLIANTDLTRAGDIVGCPLLLPDLGNEQEITMSMDLSRIDLNDQEIDKKFFYYYLMTPNVRNFMKEHSNGSTVLHLQTSRVPSLELNIPKHKVEQSTIAAVLSCIDHAIEQIETLIAKQQRIRAGLMHDLLTKGIDEHGNIRSERTHDFKESPLGRIPKEWQIASVVDVPPTGRAAIQTGPFGAQLSPKEFQPSGIPVLKIGNVQAGYLNLKELDFVTEAKASSLKRFRIKSGDLLFARQGATTGRNALAPGECDGWLINYHIIRVAVNHELCLPHYLEFCFSSHYVQYQVALSKGRSNRDGINSSDIAAIKFPLPSLNEQRQIVTTILSLSSDIETSRRLLTQYHATKQGLMQDLLSGQVSVESLLAEYATDSA